MNNQTRRFIAGAVCPECGKMDKLTIASTDQGLVQACVACDYSRVHKQAASTEGQKVFFHAPLESHER